MRLNHGPTSPTSPLCHLSFASLSAETLLQVLTYQPVCALCARPFHADTRPAPPHRLRALRVLWILESCVAWIERVQDKQVPSSCSYIITLSSFIFLFVPLLSPRLRPRAVSWLTVNSLNHLPSLKDLRFKSCPLLDSITGAPCPPLQSSFF